MSTTNVLERVSVRPGTAIGAPATHAAPRPATARTQQRRQLRGGAGIGPRLRPRAGVPAPPLHRRPALATARSCREPTAHWVLTDRAIALVLTMTMLLVLAGALVVGVSAARVTNPGYVPAAGARR